MILDIRGTNGSGKSTIVHDLIRKYGAEESATEAGTPFTLIHAPVPICAVGRYRTQCGGADGITKQDDIQRAIERLVEEEAGHVIVEGSIVATVFTRWLNLANSVPVDYDFMFLDTPVEACIQRVIERRGPEAKIFDPHKTLIPRYNAIRRVRSKLAQAGANVYDLDHTRALEQVEEHLA
jgi:cytidylate kinase